MTDRHPEPMDPETAREQALFEAALSLEDAVERNAYLDSACSGDAALRLRIVRLLEEHPGSERFFLECRSDFGLEDADGPVTEISLPRSSEEKIGARVGRYKLLRQLGEGGCGAVYLAEQEEPVRRRVALKIIKLGMDTKNVISRFEAERQALALMDHPNIARVLDAGATDSGRPYFVMDLVDGIKITRYCDERQLDVGQRLNLFIQVCHAIQHAHQKGIIHRDVKPSNILVLDHDGVPIPKVIDFGIAKAVESLPTQNTGFTLDGQFIGTPAYMSPEQAEIGALDVDTRADIYSLGVVLYELLAGRTPFDQKELLRCGLFEMRRTLREVEPRKPSSLLASMEPANLCSTAKSRHIEPAKLVKLLKGDLDWIVMKALEKDRRRRYATANALAMDLQHYLNNEPVAARPPSQLYRLRKLVLRNKAVYASGALLVTTLIAGLSLSTFLFFREREARMEAECARASETRLRREAEARQKVTQATVLLSHGQMQEADALLAGLSAELFLPSTEASSVFRAIGEWHLLAGRWKEAADRYAVLIQVNRVDMADRTTSATCDLLRAAPLLIQTGDTARYNQIRRLVVSEIGATADPSAAEQLLKVSLLLPADESIMANLEPLANCIAKSLENYTPKGADGFYPATWRTFALAVFEYRRGNFSACENWLQKCSSYSDQSPSCVASVHLFMTPIEKTRLKESIRSMVDSGCNGIDLDTQFHWVIENIREPVLFFEHIALLLLPCSVLYVEGTCIAADVSAFYVHHRARNPTPVVRDAVFPAPEIHHFTASPEVVASLRDFAAKRPIRELFAISRATERELCSSPFTTLLMTGSAFQGMCLSQP